MSKDTDLFSNPFIEQAKKSLPKEELDRLKKKGEDFFGNVDLTENPDETINKEVFLQLDSMIRSGMHPSYLNKSEREFLENYKGKTWYTIYGYLELDLNRINQ